MPKKSKISQRLHSRHLKNRAERGKKTKKKKEQRKKAKTFLHPSSSSMASKKIFHARPNYIFPTSSSICDSKIAAVDGLFELDESDVWSNNNNQVSAFETTKKCIPSSKKLSGMKKMMSERKSVAAATSASLPVNIPDWSKILKDEYEEQVQRRRDHYQSDEDFDENDDGDQDGYRMPPHEYLARKRGASLSVHEGIGRTLKGRDLRSVRNAIWKKTGFED